MIDTEAEHWSIVRNRSGIAELDTNSLRRVDDFLLWASKSEDVLHEESALDDWDTTISASRLGRVATPLRRLLGSDHELAKVVTAAHRRRNGHYRLRNVPALDVSGPHWAKVPFPDAASSLPKARLVKVDRFLEWAAAENWSVTPIQILEYDEAKTEAPLKALWSSLVSLFGADDELCMAVYSAFEQRRRSHRRSRQSQPKHRHKTRAELLGEPQWARLRSHPAALSMPMERLRIVDRFFIFCTARAISNVAAEHILEFLPTQKPSRIWELRVAMEMFYGLEHPIVQVVEEARRSRYDDYMSDRGLKGPSDARPKPRLSVSVPAESLPASWRDALDRLEAGEPVRGHALSPGTVRGMRQVARELLCSTRKAELPDEVSIETVRAYASDLDVRGLRPSSKASHVHNLWRLARTLGCTEMLVPLKELEGYYRARGAKQQKSTELKYAALPGLPEIFERAYVVLERGSTERDARKRIRLLVDAAAGPFLSLIPLRNADTVLRWGSHLTYRGEVGDDWIYRINTSILKTDAHFSGELHPVLNRFLEAIILQGRHEKFLPRLRQAAIDARAPVFPTSSGGARCTTALSRSWQRMFGVGAHIARTQVHTLLGAYGPEGVDAALALCAHRSAKSRKHYQAEALRDRLMREGQSAFFSILPEQLIEERLAALGGDEETLSDL